MEFLCWREDIFYLFYSFSMVVHLYCSLLSPFSCPTPRCAHAVIWSHLFWLCFFRQSWDRTDSASHTVCWIQNTLKFYGLTCWVKLKQTKWILRISQKKKKIILLEWDIQASAQLFLFLFRFLFKPEIPFSLRNSSYLSPPSHSLAPENTSVKCSC